MANAQARATFLTEGMIGDLTGKCARVFYSVDDVNVERVYYLIIVEIRRKTNVIVQGDMEIDRYCMEICLENAGEEWVMDRIYRCG